MFFLLSLHVLADTYPWILYNILMTQNSKLDAGKFHGVNIFVTGQGRLRQISVGGVTLSMAKVARRIVEAS